MVLVVGATGLVGLEVCRKLAARGEKVRAFTRASSDAEKVDTLRASGVEICIGDLKDPASLVAACTGVDAIVSTASSTFSRQPGDSIESVDAEGQLNLVRAAKSAGVKRFVFVSFRRPPGMSFPVGDAKEAVEAAIADMDFTIIQASYFMEVWLNPALGFDYAVGKARVSGAGTAPTSWVSFRDVAELCAVVVRQPAASRAAILCGGPKALSLIEVVACFERLGSPRFQLEHVPLEVLHEQFAQAIEPMQKSFAALMLGAAYGDAMEMAPVVEQFGLRLTSVEEYARAVLVRA